MSDLRSKLFDDDFKKEISEQIIKPDYKEKVRFTLRSEGYWTKISQLLMITYRILIGVSAVLSFCGNKYPESNAAFYSGVISVVSLQLAILSSVAANQEHIKNLELNNIFKTIGMDIRVPDDIIEQKSTDESKI